MATPQLHYPDGRLQHLPRRKPTPWLLLARQLAPKFGTASSKKRTTTNDAGRGFDRAPPHCVLHRQLLWPCAPMYSKEILAGLTPAYFMYVEDADLTQKVLQGHCPADAAVFRHPCTWHRAPMRDAGKFKMQLGEHGAVFQKNGAGKGTF